MRKFIIFLFILPLLVTNCKSPRIKDKAKTEAVKGLNYFLGTVANADTVKHAFLIKNIGSSPLVIDSVSTSCGCVNTTWPKSPVMPGALATINTAIAPDTKFKGKIMQFVVVRTNAENPITVFKLFYVMK